MAELSHMQRAACEAVWRALHDRQCDTTGQGLSAHTPEPVLRAQISAYVCTLPLVYLPRLILPEINRHGVLYRGYTNRWANVSAASDRYDAHKAAELARGQMRMSEMPAWPQTPSGSTGSRSRDTSSDGDNAQVSAFARAADADTTPTQERCNPSSGESSDAVSALRVSGAARPPMHARNRTAPAAPRP